MGELLSIKSVSPAVKRGDIYFADLNGLQLFGCEQGGNRPVIIIQNNKGNKHSPTTIVAVLTTKLKKRWLPTHVMIPHFENLPRNSMACLEQIKTIDKSRLREYCGNVGNKMMDKIDQAICTSLGTKGNFSYESMTFDEESKEVETMDTKLKKDTTFDGKENNWLQFAEQQLIFFSEIKQYMINLEITREITENETAGILDYISSTNYNVTQGYKIYRLLREHRKQQQQIDEELRQLDALTKQLDCEQMKQFYQNAIAAMQKTDLESLKILAIQQLLEAEVG